MLPVLKVSLTHIMCSISVCQMHKETAEWLNECVLMNFFTKNKSLNLRYQQDAQEFLSILLDCLHEDLNRITNKPYILLEEQKPTESDLEASQRFWDLHKRRENSIIVDLFHGQFKSKITCSACGKSSITYEPFIFLGLPIPQNHNQEIIHFFLEINGNFSRLN